MLGFNANNRTDKICSSNGSRLFFGSCHFLPSRKHRRGDNIVIETRYHMLEPIRLGQTWFTFLLEFSSLDKVQKIFSLDQNNRDLCRSRFPNRHEKRGTCPVFWNSKMNKTLALNRTKPIIIINVIITVATCLHVESSSCLLGPVQSIG